MTCDYLNIVNLAGTECQQTSRVIQVKSKTIFVLNKVFYATPMPIVVDPNMKYRCSSQIKALGMILQLLRSPVIFIVRNWVRLLRVKKQHLK